MFRVLTVAREYGSGGARIAQMVADRLSWKLLDSNLITEIGRTAKIETQLLRQFDEHVDPWLHRLIRRSLLHGAFEGVACIPEAELLDAESLAHMTYALIGQAYELGNCVIVGRGGQCVLQDRPDAFHAFVYAPWREKLERIRSRAPECGNVEGLIRATDAERAEYVRLNFQCEWNDPHLYHLLVSSTLGEEAAASLILAALGAARP